MRIFTLITLLFFITSITAQTYRVLDYEAHSHIASWADGDMIGYTVEVHDTMNGEPRSSFDSIRYHYDNQDRPVKIELFRTGFFPEEDTIFDLDQWLEAGYLNDTQVAYVVYHGDGLSLPPTQPRDSVVYEYYSNGLVKTKTTYNYNNGGWEPGERVRHMRLPDGRDTAQISETYSGGSWSKTYYRQFIYNEDSLLKERNFYWFINEPWEPISKWKYTYNSQDLTDTFQALNYDDSMEALVPHELQVTAYDTAGAQSLEKEFRYDTANQQWKIQDSVVYSYPPDTYYVRQMYLADSSGQLVHEGFDVRITDTFGHAFTDWKEYYFEQGDTIMALDRKRFYLNNGYPDSFYSYQKSTPFNINSPDQQRRHESKFYYSYGIGSVGQMPEPIGATLFPNPAGDVLNLRLDEMPRDAIHYRIYGIDGRLIGNGHLPPSSINQLPLPDESGTYIYELEIDGKRVGKKVVRE